MAAVWNDRKCFNDYVKLSKLLSDEYLIVLVGVSKDQKRIFPKNIVGIERTQNQFDLAHLYSMADILLSLSTGETFGMTMAEAYACGTPCIVYDNTAQPEIVTPETGRVVKSGDIATLLKIVKDMCDSSFKTRHSSDCRKRAVEGFDRNKCFEKYINLYNSLLAEK